MKLIVYDLEATCWLGRPPKGQNEIIEIGAYMINGFGDIEDDFNRFVRPVVNPVLSPFCKKLTSIEQENVDRADTFDIVIEDFLNWIDEEDPLNYVLISWGEQDAKYFRNDCRLHNIEADWVDRCLNAKNHYKKISGKNRQFGLVSALENEGMNFDGKAHRAINDAYNLAKLVVRYKDEWYK